MMRSGNGKVWGAELESGDVDMEPRYCETLAVGYALCVREQPSVHGVHARTGMWNIMEIFSGNKFPNKFKFSPCSVACGIYVYTRMVWPCIENLFMETRVRVADWKLGGSQACTWAMGKGSRN